MNSLQHSSLATIDQYQDTELKKLLRYLETNSAFYREHFRKHQIDISKINTSSDLSSIPVVTKDELQEHNWDFLCVNKNEIIELCTTSGTMGKPVIIALTESDLKRLAANELESFTCASLTSNDVFLLMLSLDRQFMAGIAYYLGARQLGATIIRGGPGNFGMQIETIQRLEPTVLIAVPSFIVGLISYARDMNVSLNSTSVKTIICIGENIRNENLELNSLGERILKEWNVKLISTYASTEQQTAFTECEYGMGGHHHPELMIFEIVDDKGNIVPAGTYGELVITTLGVEGMPLLRYNTGDICTYFDTPCKCGRTTKRISPISGRKQQMIKFKGTTIYPQAVFNLLNSMESIQDYVVSLMKNQWGTDDLKIHISLNPKAQQPDSVIKHSFQSALRVVPEIQYVTMAEIQKMQVIEGKRKLNKLIDLR